MADKCWAVVGSWSHIPGERGLWLCSYDSVTAKMEIVSCLDDAANVGWQYYDPARQVLYVMDETPGPKGEHGGGGVVRAFRFDNEQGTFILLNERCVLLSNPSYFCLDVSGNYALVSAHTTLSAVTKLVKEVDGSLTSKVVYDDSGIVLLRIEPDGSLGEICDAIVYDAPALNRELVHSHVHCVISSPDGNIFFACDLGLDRIYSYRIDRRMGRIIPLSETPLEYASLSRHMVFSKNLPLFYENCEGGNYINVYSFNEDTGAIHLVQKAEYWGKSEKQGSTDIVLSDDGKYLYVSATGIGRIVVFEIDEQSGCLKLIQTVEDGSFTRGLTATPDGKYLLSSNCSDGTVRAYTITSDGALSYSGNSINIAHASNVSIIT